MIVLRMGRVAYKCSLYVYCISLDHDWRLLAQRMTMDLIVHCLKTVFGEIKGVPIIEVPITFSGTYIYT